MQPAIVPDLMTTAEVAAYLRLKERKLYELVRERRIPCARITGKLLFPRRLVDLWVGRHVDFAGDLPDPPPPVIAGSHDPLLDWAVRESGCGLALLTAGSEDGLRRLARGDALAAGLHIVDPTTGDYNVPALTGMGPLGDLVMIEWAWRDQGLVVATGNPLRLAGLADVATRRARLAIRQEGAGAQILLRHLILAAGLDYAAFNLAGPPAIDETELALAVLDGKADCGIAVRAVARRHRLDFLPLHRERFDVVLRRRDFFEPPMQRLLAFARSDAFARRAAELSGYDVAGIGRVTYNA
jgi:excisionase family DNA binding protein